MSVGHRKHVVSIDVELDSEKSKQSQQKPIKKHKLTIMVQCNDSKNKKISIRNQTNNSQNKSSKVLTSVDRSCKKYYFNRNIQKSKGKRSEVGNIVTDRKYQQNQTTSKNKEKPNAKSYRIHTIDYVEQDNKKDQIYEVQHQRSVNVLTDITYQKSNYIDKLKNKIKKKNVINQSELIDFTARTKIVDQYAKRENDDLSDPKIKHYKIIKSKTQLEDTQQNQRENKQNKISKFVLSQRNTTADILSKPSEINPLRNLIIKLNKSQKNTIELKKFRKVQRKSQQQIQIQNNAESELNIQEQDRQFALNKNSNFNKYLQFIHKRRNRQNVINKAKIIRNFPEGRSLVVKSTLLKQTIQLKQKQQDNSKKQQKTKQMLKIQKKVNASQIIQQQNRHKNKQQQKLNIFKSNQFDFSAIPQVNQSSFLSDSAKKQVVQINTFCLPNFGQQISKIQILNKLQRIKSNVSYQPDQSSSKKKKKKKRQSKMSLICRSQMKHVFPQRFFA